MTTQERATEMFRAITAVAILGSSFFMTASHSYASEQTSISFLIVKRAATAMWAADNCTGHRVDMVLVGRSLGDEGVLDEDATGDGWAAQAASVQVHMLNSAAAKYGLSAMCEDAISRFDGTGTLPVFLVPE